MMDRLSSQILTKLSGWVDHLSEERHQNCGQKSLFAKSGHKFETCKMWKRFTIHE